MKECMYSRLSGGNNTEMCELAKTEHKESIM